MKPVTLIIMDGYGIADPSKTNAISLAKKPNLDRIFTEYGTKTLDASGSAVGLPDGQMGNSEVGHMNIGAGRVVWQSLSRINNAIKDDTLKDNKALVAAFQNVLDHNSKFHLMGLVSDGGVHCHVDHLVAIAKAALAYGIKDVYLHCFLDGRDVNPKSAISYIDYITERVPVKIATVSGRFYSMDRDKNYDRIQLQYDAMTKGDCPAFASYKEGIEASYNDGVFDEFIKPFIVNKEGILKDHDSCVFANFRPDRAIQISSAITNPTGIVYNPDKPYRLDASVHPNVHFVSMMPYSEQVQGSLVFDILSLDNLFGDVLAKNNKTQLRIAETEKYAHVTFFFDGGKDRDIEGADRILVNSPKVKTYDLQPEMSAYTVRDKVIEAIKTNKYDAIILNFANCDMVGHTGNLDAAVKAVEAVDECVGSIVSLLEEVGGVALITADHGNCEQMVDENGEPYTAHTTNLVPVCLTSKDLKIRDGILSDIAPTLLELLGLEIPSEMTSKSLIVK